MGSRPDKAAEDAWEHSPDWRDHLQVGDEVLFNMKAGSDIAGHNCFGVISDIAGDMATYVVIFGEKHYRVSSEELMYATGRSFCLERGEKKEGFKPADG